MVHVCIDTNCCSCAGLIVEEPEGVRPRDTFSPVALAVVIAIGVALLLFIVFFVAALVFGTYRSRRQRQRAIAGKSLHDVCHYGATYTLHM